MLRRKLNLVHLCSLYQQNVTKPILTSYIPSMNREKINGFREHGIRDKNHADKYVTFSTDLSVYTFEDIDILWYQVSRR